MYSLLPAYLMGFLALWAGYLLPQPVADWRLDARWLHVDYRGFAPRGDFRLLSAGPLVRITCLAALGGVPSVASGRYLPGWRLGGCALLGGSSRSAHGTPERWRRPQGVTAVLVLVVAGLSSRTPAMHDATLVVAQRYQVTPTSEVLNQDEMNVINEIPKIVPKGDTIVNNPWDGSALHLRAGRPPPDQLPLRVRDFSEVCGNHQRFEGCPHEPGGLP